MNSSQRSLALLRALPGGVILAHPAGRQRSGVQQPQLRLPGRKLRKHARRAVGGLVVDHHDFADFGLRGKRKNRALDGGFFVAHGENRGYGIARGSSAQEKRFGERPGLQRATALDSRRNQREALL